jgi:hypothetical protein
MTSAYVFVKTATKLDVGGVIIMWHQADWRQNIIEHSSLKVKYVDEYTCERRCIPM